MRTVEAIRITNKVGIARHDEDRSIVMIGESGSSCGKYVITSSIMAKSRYADRERYQWIVNHRGIRNHIGLG